MKKEKSAEIMARRFHETYERLAPIFKYATRTESAVPWEDVPENNKELMIAVCGEVMEEHIRQLKRIAETPEYNQDDAHRLRGIAKGYLNNYNYHD